MSISQDIVMSLLETLMLYMMLMSVKKYQDEKVITKGLIFIVVSTVISIGLGNVLELGGYGQLLNIIIGLLLYIFLFKNDLISSLTIYIISDVLLIINQFVVIVILGLIFDGFEYSFFWGLISSGINLCIAYIIYRFVPLEWISYYIDSKNTSFYRIVINLFIIYLTVLFIWRNDSGRLLDITVLVGIIIALTIIFNIIIANSGLKNMTLVERNKMLETYIPLIEDSIEDMRLKQHDFNNHLAVLDTLANSEDYIQYRNTMQNSFKTQELLKLENKVIAALLSSKSKRADELGVNLEYDISTVSLQVNIPDYNLVEIVGEMLENAIRAAEQSEKKFVRCAFEKSENEVVMTFANSTVDLNEEEVEKMFKRGYTTKDEEGHGMGLYKVKQMINKYGGKIAYSYSGEVNEVSMVIYMID